MRVKEYQMDELARARALQDEAAKLHIPVSVLSWRYEIKDKNGKIEEKGIGKSNSYTRNALNSIAWFAGLCAYNVSSSTIFADGLVSIKNTTGTLASPSNFERSNVNPTISLGTSTAAESLDSYALSSSGLTEESGSIISTFNSTTRKMITAISQVFSNNTASSISVVESGIILRNVAGSYMLFVRDTFDEIFVANGKTITWTYVTEVSYPNP
jgi:hypothetical protein